MITTPSGRTVLDFGQNLVGRLRLTVDGPAGTVITLRHAEVLEHDELGTRPLRLAKATDTLTLAGDGPITWEPELTFHGFRYAEIDGWPGAFDPAAVTAQVIHSDMERTGWFASSHALVDRLHENVVWGLRGNFLYVPTDCPQRDERLGWTGDIQVFTPTASFLYDVHGFLTSWLTDLELEQEHAGGIVPFVVPSVLQGRLRPAAAWGDAATVVPTVLHERYGDQRVLTDQLASMQAWTDVIVERSGDRHLWEGQFQFADWLDPSAPPERPAEAKTHPDIVATAYVFRSADLTARAAALLGETAVAEKYAAIAERVRRAFLAEYVTPAGRMVSDAQTGYALAIMFDLVADGPAAGARRSAGRAGPVGRLHHRHRLRRHPDRGRRAVEDRSSGDRDPVAHPDRVPVVALPGDHGRHHHLGAVGLDAARRHHQPGRDDQLQPLRPRVRWPTGCTGWSRVWRRRPRGTA